MKTRTFSFTNRNDTLCTFWEKIQCKSDVLYGPNLQMIQKIDIVSMHGSHLIFWTLLFGQKWGVHYLSGKEMIVERLKTVFWSDMLPCGKMLGLIKVTQKHRFIICKGFFCQLFAKHALHLKLEEDRNHMCMFNILS